MDEIPVQEKREIQQKQEDTVPAPLVHPRYRYFRDRGFPQRRLGDAGGGQIQSQHHGRG
jgi:hypothetical protein